jgi:hypothetical protein
LTNGRSDGGGQKIVDEQSARDRAGFGRAAVHAEHGSAMMLLGMLD